MMLLLVHVVRLQRVPKKCIHILRDIYVKCVYIFGTLCIYIMIVILNMIVGTDLDLL
jgi:hypothetical protein